MVEPVVLYATLAGCACFIGWVVLRYDLIDREPWYAITFALLAGALMMYLAGRVQGRIILTVADHCPRVLGSGFFSVLAGVLEELGKVGAVAMVAACFRRHFNDPIDGLIYGSFAGLGAALEESVWLLGADPGAAGVPWQEPVRLAGHLVMGGIGGWGLGTLVGPPSPGPIALPVGLGAAVVLHVAWDVAAFEAVRLGLENGRAPAWTTGLAMTVMLTGMVAYRSLVGRGAAMSAARFAA
ncbi:MAG: PrsW family intramembrane metalloprotease [Leptolyngbya sp. PLA1]|nr:PrsW family intramembrane metalloprotease [Leptolyngbya sp. PLA1]